MSSEEEVTTSFIDDKVNEGSVHPDVENQNLSVQKTSTKEPLIDELDVENTASALNHELRREEVAIPVNQGPEAQTNYSLEDHDIETNVGELVVRDGESLIGKSSSIEDSKDVGVDNTIQRDNLEPHEQPIEALGIPVKSESHNSNSPGEEQIIVQGTVETHPTTEIDHLNSAVEIFSAGNQRRVEPMALVESVMTVPPIEVHAAPSENDNAIQVIEDKGRLIITAQTKTRESDAIPEADAQNHGVAIFTLAELNTTFGVIEHHLLKRDGPEGRTNATNDETEKLKEVVVAVSSPMLEIVSLLADMTKIEPKEKDGDLIIPEQTVIIFMALNDTEQQLLVSEDQSKWIHEFLQVLEPSIFHSEDQEVEDTGTYGEILMEEAREILEEVQSKIAEETAIPRVEISEDMYIFLEKGVTVIELIEKMKSELSNNEFELEENTPKQVVQIIFGDREMEINLESLQKLLQLYSKQINREEQNELNQESSYIFEPTLLTDDSYELGKTIPDQEMYVEEAQVIIDEVQYLLAGEITIPTIEVSEAIITFTERKLPLIKLLERAQNELSNRDREEEYVSKQEIRLLFGEKEILIELESLQKLLLLYSKKVREEATVNRKNFDFAFEEIAHDDSFLKTGYIQSDWFTYQEFLALMGILDDIEFMDEKIHYPLFQSL